MTRFKITLEYDGSHFIGWQRQSNGVSVQEVLEDAAACLNNKAPVLVYGAGRTDTGVHATGQVAHLDLNRAITGDRLRAALNALVRPHPVSVLDCQAVPVEFHARFSAISRRYLFRILDRVAPPALDYNRVWWVSHPLDLDAMNAATEVLLGHHDFTSFRATHCQAKSPLRTLDHFKFRRVGAEIHSDIEARSFLHNQVRIMIGSLRFVGEGKWTKDDLYKALKAKDRCAAGPTARPEGLYLAHIGYPPLYDSLQTL